MRKQSTHNEEIKFMLGQRLKEFRKKLDITVDELSQNVNVKPRTIGGYERGEREPSFEYLNKLLNIYSLNIKWLLTGDGNMFEDKHLANGELTYQIPIRGEVEASCGYGVTVYDENVTSTYSISKKFTDDLGINPKSSEIIFARGDSMEPTIQGGDCLLVDKSKTEIYDGKIYCTRIDGQVYAKRFQKIPSSIIYLGVSLSSTEMIFAKGDSMQHK